MNNPLPNLVIVGAPRCGTSALFTALAAHPEVAGSSVKEVQYFMDEDSALFNSAATYHRHGLAAYHRFFEQALKEKPEASIVLEATPGYMYQRTALEVLPTLPTRPKFVFQLRNPADQLYSSYRYSLHNLDNLPPRTTFREFVFGSGAISSSDSEFHRNALSFASYEPFVSDWLNACGEARVWVTCLEPLRRDPRTHLQKLAGWLGIEGSFYDDYDLGIVNQSVGVRSRAVQSAARRVSMLLPARVRESGRGLYRRLNTRPLSPPSREEQAVIAEIDELLREPIAQLEARYALDLHARAG